MLESESGSVVSDSLQLQGPKPAKLLCPWNSPGKTTGVGCQSLLSGTSQLNDPTCVSCCSCLPWQANSLLLSHQIKYYPAITVWLNNSGWTRDQLPTPVFWPGEFHGQRKLAGYSLWDHKESDMTERLALSHSQKY